MTKRIFTLAIILFGTLSFHSCRETTEKETVIREVEPEVEVIEEEEGKGILERTGEAIDEEVNEEINEEIERIGDDN